MGTATSVRLVKTGRRPAGGIDALVATEIAEPQSPTPRQAEAAGSRVDGYEHGARRVGEVDDGLDGGEGRYAIP